MIDQAPPCQVVPGAIHFAILVLQSVTTIAVTWLANRAKNKDRDERRRNGHDSNGR